MNSNECPQCRAKAREYAALARVERRPALAQVWVGAAVLFQEGECQGHATTTTVRAGGVERCACCGAELYTESGSHVCEDCGRGTSSHALNVRRQEERN